jgi:2-polyprenyl-3-methyl-5-hydroxy-6-metoxy-1,4-benzoquinol methylase
MKRHGFDGILNMDAEDIQLKEKFDLILACDVIEHISNPGKFFERVPHILSDEGYLIVSVPSAFSFSVLKLWFLGKEQVHKDHVYYFSPKTLATLCSRYDLYPTNAAFTVQAKDEYESSLFVQTRNMFLSVLKTMSPSFIMHFRHKCNVNTKRYMQWR